MILYSGMLNQLQNCIMRELVLLWVVVVPVLSSYTLLAWINSRFTFVHKGLLVITQGWTSVSEQDL